MLNTRILLILLSTCLLSSCKSHKSDEDIILPAVGIYENALQRLENGKYKKAAEEFANVYYQHPGSKITPFAELMEAYSYYLAKESEDCMDVLDNFIKLHPVHEDIAYAYYLRAMAAFSQMSDIYYDQSKTLDAQETLKNVIDKFPGTEYASDAANKLEIAKDYLAAKNMEIGKYYITAKNNPVAAIGRFKEIIKSDTEHAPEAFYRLYESFLAIGLQDEAYQYAQQLISKYPNNEWSLKVEKKLKTQF
jgi:outer membrane protein assembly factor BamD